MKKKGFTLIEVALFLAITGMLFIGIAAGVQNSIYQQKINDSVQGFAEFLRSVYSEVTNVQGISGGRSNRAIYGKLITFGEEEGKDRDENKIYSYTVVGRADGATTGSALQVLKDLNANVITVDTNGVVKPINIVESYSPRWSASIEPACKDNGDCEYKPFVGALLVVRHPKSGAVQTYISEEKNALKINSEIERLNQIGRNQTTEDDEGKVLLPNLLFGSGDNYNGFRLEQIDFCVNPNPGEENAMRRDVRIIRGARNASGVEIISDAESKCVKE